MKKDKRRERAEKFKDAICAAAVTHKIGHDDFMIVISIMLRDFMRHLKTREQKAAVASTMIFLISDAAREAMDGTEEAP